MTFVNVSEYGEYPQVRDVMWKTRHRRGGWGCCLRNSNNSKILRHFSSLIEML